MDEISSNEAMEDFSPENAKYPEAPDDRLSPTVDEILVIQVLHRCEAKIAMNTDLKFFIPCFVQ